MVWLCLELGVGSRPFAKLRTPYVLRAERVVRLMLIPVLRVACVDTIAWARAVSVREPMRPVRAHTAIYAACRRFYICPIWLTSLLTFSLFFFLSIYFAEYSVCTPI